MGVTPGREIGGNRRVDGVDAEKHETGSGGEPGVKGGGSASTVG